MTPTDILLLSLPSSDVRHGRWIHWDRVCPTNTWFEFGAEKKWHIPGQRHISEWLLRDVVWSVPVGSCLLSGLPPAGCSAVIGHSAPAQDRPVYAHCHHSHGHHWTTFWRCPHQCSHCWCVQGSREEDDLSGGSCVWCGPVVLCPYYLFLQGFSYTLAGLTAPRWLHELCSLWLQLDLLRSWCTKSGPGHDVITCNEPEWI